MGARLLMLISVGFLAASCGGQSGAKVLRPRLDDAPPFVEPMPAYGELTGECGVLDDEEWNAATPFYFDNDFDFGDEPFSTELLSVGGQEVVADGNLNDGSLLSEAIAFEALFRCEGAALLETETEVEYVDPNGKKTDLVVNIDGHKVGVSVTRAFAYPLGSPYEATQAEDLLAHKLGDIPLSAANAQPADAWERSILHVIAYDDQAAGVVSDAYDGLDPSLTLDTIVIVTATDGDDTFIYE